MAVVVQHRQARRLQAFVEFVACRNDVGDVGVQGDELDVVGSYGTREHDAVVVVVLLDSGRQKALDADAVAAHDDRVTPAVLIRVVSLESLAEVCAQLEDVADLDAAHLGQGASARNLHSNPACALAMSPTTWAWKSLG